MFELAKKRYFGINIGETAVKFIEVIKTPEGFRVTRARLEELHTDPTFEEGDKRSKAVKAAVKKIIDEAHIASGAAAISISGQSVFVRPLKVPKIAKNKITQIIQYEAQLQVPFPINEVIWNYELFETYDNPETEVVLVAVKKEIVDEKLSLLEGTGLDIDFVEVDPFSLYNAAEYFRGMHNTIILDIGAKITDIIIIEENKIWTRSILIGGSDMTKAIASQLKISYAEAEELKRREGIIALRDRDKEVSPHAGEISDAINPILVELITDISKTIGYYKSQFSSTQVFKQVHDTGGCVNLRNLTGFIEKNLEIPAVQFNLFEQIKAHCDCELPDKFAYRMDVATGLALRTVIPLSTRTNLLPPALLREKEFEKKKWYIFGSLAAAVLLCMTITGFLNWLNHAKQRSLAKATHAIERYTKIHDQIIDRQGDIDRLTATLNAIKDVSVARGQNIATLAEIFSLLPEDMWLTGIEKKEQTITLKGRAKESFENVGLFRNALAESKLFIDADVEQANVVQAEEGMSGDIRSFVISLTVDSGNVEHMLLNDAAHNPDGDADAQDQG